MCAPPTFLIAKRARGVLLEGRTREKVTMHKCQIGMYNSGLGGVGVGSQVLGACGFETGVRRLCKAEGRRGE